MLATEELYLLLTRPNGDPTVPGLGFGSGLSAALLTDLVVAGRVAIVEGSPPRVQVLSTAPSGELLIDWGLERIPDKDGQSVESVIRWGRFDPEVAVVESLVQSGVLERGKRKLFGFGMHRVIERDPAPKQHVLDRLSAVFAADAAPTPADAAIVAALQAMAVTPLVLRDHIAAAREPDEQQLADIVTSAPLPGGAAARAAFAVDLTVSDGFMSKVSGRDGAPIMDAGGFDGGGGGGD